MGCVNKNGSEFKNLAAKHNLDANTLELIVHKYWLQTGREDLFPTDVYIQAQLGNGVYRELGKAVRKLWNKYYSSTQEFPSMERLQVAYSKAAKYFPMSAIYYYKNANGNYILSVKRPVEKANYTKDDFFDDYDDIGSMRNVKTLNLDIEQDKSYGIGKIQDLFDRFNTDRTSKELADKIFTVAKDLGIKVIFNESLPFGTMGRYQNNNTIILKKSFLERDFMNDKKAAIMLHEVLHSLTMYALSDSTKNWKKTEALEQFKTDMNSLYQDLKSNPLLKNERGVVDVKEFVAELANPVFRSKIQEIDKQNKARENKSFWNKILNAFKHLLGIHASDSYYERSMNALNKALNAFDIDTYMRYNGIKNKLRREIANNKIDTQLNKSINVIKDAAVSGKWTTEALNELNNLIKDLENEKTTYQRFPKEAARGWHQGGRANEIASILLGASNGASKENPRSFTESQRRSQEEKPIQERIIERWAKAEGIWYDNLDTIKGKKKVAEGGEAKVFHNGNEENVTKILSTEYFITPQFALDRITLHNTLFPIAPLKVIGFGRNSKGEFQFLVEQPFIQGEPATQEEIDRFITKAGFEKSKKDKGNTFISDDLYLSDLHDENVIKTSQGTLVVIDADLRLNTPDLNMEGKYEVNDSIVSMKDADYNEFKKTLSDKQLKDEISLIKQEEADYDVLFDIESVSKKSGKAVPQDFTFADGTTIKAPFKPNEQQEDTLNVMSRFIKSNETTMTLSGYAGTGKTSIMEMIAQKCKKQGKPVMFCASTNKAAAVLDSKVSKAGFKATTLNKLFGINVEIDSTQKSYNARNLVNVLKDVDILPGTTIIIDEASMINEENYKIINEIAKDNHLKIIYVGDSAQLAPVNENQISKVFRNGDGKVITLTQVERTDDNAILKEATNIRNGKPLSGETSFNSKGEGVAYLSPQHQDAINEVISHYVEGLKKDPNYFRILAYTNKAVSDYNTQIRSLLGYDSPIPQVGEPMTGYANWGYNWKTKSYRFVNSKSYKVTKVGNPKTDSVMLDDGTIVSLQAIPVTLTDSSGNVDTFDFIDIKGNPQNRQAASMIAYEKKRLWALAKHTYGKAAKAEIYSRINSLDAHLFVNDNIEDAEHNLLQQKTIDFGYALTIHKSQGSTFTNVLIDDVDVSKAIRSNNPMEAIESVDLDGNGQLPTEKDVMNSIEDVDLGDLTGAIIEKSNTSIPISSQNNTANIKQQLEYVGVSRATDTVTIISNNVKQEGSPLHYQDSIRETNHKDDTINTNDSRSDNEVTKQIIAHLKSMGINVLDRAAMQKFFEEHPDMAVQMASSNYYMDLDSAEEAEVLRHDLFGQFKNKSSFGCIGHTANYWYLCDYLGDSNYKVRAQIAIDGNEKLINDFEREIRGESFRSPEDFNRRFEAFKAAKGQYYNGGTDAKVRITTNDNVGMAASKLQGRQNANKRGSNGYGSVYNAKDGVEFFLTPQGEVYGFVDKDGNIYLDETKISPEHPIHEYTHLWDRAVAKHNPELWNRGIELMKQTSLWNEILNDPNYGKKWLALKGMTQDKLASLIASEAHARLTGKNGADILEDIAKQKGKQGIVSKLKQWLLDFWRNLKETFTPWSEDELDHLTLENFKNMTLKDFSEGINPLKVRELQKSKQPTNVPASYEGMITPDKNTVFVFGSNPEGRHDAGAAKVAREKFGAKYGQGEGLQGNAYALPTKDLSVKFSIMDDQRQKPLVVGRDDTYFDLKHSTHDNPISLKIKKIENGNVTFAKMEWVDSKEGFIRDKVEGEVKTVSEAEFKKMAGMDTYSYRYSNRYGFADIHNTGRITTDGHPVFSLEISIPEDRHQGRGIGSKIYEDVIDKLASEGAYLMPGLVAAENHKWEALEKQGRLKEVTLSNGNKVYVAIPKKGADLSKNRNFTVRSMSEKTIINNIKDMYTTARQNPSKMFKVAYTNGLNERSLNGYTGAEMIRMFKEAGPIPSNVAFSKNWTDHWNEVSSSKDNNTINNNNNETRQYKQTDEFRRVQEAVRGSGKGESSRRSVFEGYFTPDQRQRLANVLERQLGSIDSFIHGSSRNVTNQNHGTSFKIHSEVNPTLFHDVFEVVRYYTKNAELVDLHDDYSDCKCYLSEDGTTGFAIEPDGNLISVFNLGTTRGFLGAIKDMIREEGATHLDAYASSKQNLEQMYEKTLGFHTASTMDYNMEYDHDDIAKNHGNPQVVFMVDHEVENPKHFDKDSYDAAQQYQLDQLNNTKQVENKESKAENPTFEEGKTFTVKLPSYEYFNDLYEDTTVDAEWKIPYLQKLDSQISNDNTAEENQAIINQMNTIMDATSEKEYNQQLKDPKGVKKTLNEYEKFIQQLDNLLEGGNEDYDEFGAKISASEVRHTAELIINEVSDEITRLQTEEGRAKEIFPEINTKIDFKTATRRQIVDAIGINTLLDRVKNLFDSETAMYDDDVTSLQADLITENWDAFITMAADVFAFNEGFGITKDYSKGNFTTTDEAKADFDNFNDYSNDPDVVAEEGEKDEQEHWQVEMKTIDVLNSMSDLVRQGLRECYLLDENGEKVMSKWGIAERVNPRKATNSILRWTQGSMSLDNMITKLSDKSTKNPWLSQLIEKLSDKSGKYTDFQSQFYGVFQKHFQPYSIVVTEDGKYHSMLVNSHPALSDAMRTITSKFKTQTHPLFIGNMIKKEALGSESTISEKHDFNLHKALYELQNIIKSLTDGNTIDGDMFNKAKGNILGICRLMGYDITEDALSDVINEPTLKKEVEYLQYMIKDLDKAYEAQHQGKLKDYNPFAYGVKNNIDGALRNFLTPITDVMEDTAVSAFYDSGKMYQSYVTPSFMTKLMNKFKLTGQKFQDFMMDEYASSEWFAFDKFGDYNRIQWRNEWLRLLQNEDARKVFAHKVELNFNKHNYMRNMTDAEYTLSLITEYFAESTDRTEDKVPAWFRIPMQSNKPSSDFIKFYSYRGSNYKTSITNNLYEMFLQELSRIQTVRMRNLDKKDAGFIKNFDTNGRKFNFLPVFNAYLENTPTALVARNRLHNTVEYDETRLMELQLRYSEWERGDILGTFKDADEYYDLMDKKEASDRALTTEEDTRFAILLQKKLNGEEALTSVEEAQLGNLALKIIRQSTENRVQSILDNWEASGILESAKNIKNIYPISLDNEGAAKYVRSQVENFLWNDALASKNILQLTIGDIAFYKDTEDLQKRLAQLHAPGIRGNIYAVDYNGNRVSDGKYRTFILKDFDTFKSNLIANISEVFDRKIAAAPDGQKPIMEALKESLVGADGKYTHINVTDAQGYSSPTSYRKKAFIFGRWSHQAEDIYQKLKSGKYTFSDLETAFQPLKPFVYTKLTKNMGVENAPIHTMPVPFQAKNAEYLLIMADALLQGEELSRPNLLRAVYRVMEDSAYNGRTYNKDGSVKNPGKYNGKGIDTVQFESAIKSGLQTPIDINQFMDTPNGEEAAYTYMKNLIYKNGSNEYNKDAFVNETSFDDYCIQQEVPEHFKEHSQAHGSQIRMITPSDLDYYTTDGKVNMFPVRMPDGSVQKLNANEIREKYEQTCADNIGDSLITLSKELHLDSTDKKERNIALSKILIKEVLSSPRYGVDLIQACSLNSDGEFRIPKGDPIQAKRIEQLINSIIKNRVNKQKIAGGPIVQVSNFGTSKQLHIRFNDKQGNLLPMESEYVPSEHDNLSYKDYIKENQGGIAYFEVFAPIWSNEIFDKFSNPDGSINIDAINGVDPELLKMVSYRIPTEDKYSCAPIKVVGFMPREAGDAIMFPYELTEIDDSDFDVDKRYVMRKDIPIKTKETGEYIDQLIETGKKLYKEIMGTEATAGSVVIGDRSDYVKKMVDSLVKNPTKFPKNSPFRKALYSEYQKLAYKTEAPTSGKGYRDNKIIDMTYAVLTNEMTADKILNPGGFDALKKMGYMVAAYKNHANEGIKWSDLQGMSIDELKELSYIDKDLTFADTQVQFYKQNLAAVSLIGVFAINKVAHAILESNGIYLDVAEVCGEQPFTIADTTFEGKMEIDMKYDQNRTLIGKILGSLVSASADAVKYPILNLMNINMTTAGILNTMLRFGMPFNDAALFLSQDIIERLLTQFNRENLTNCVSLDSLITKWLDKYREQNNITDSSALNTEPLTRDELVEGLKSSEHGKIDYKVLLAFQKMRILTDCMRKPTFATRFNSISSAVGPLIIDNLITEHKRDAFKGDTQDTHFYTLDSSNAWVPYTINNTFQAHPILAKFAETLDIAKSMFMDMPTGSNGFRNLLNKLPKDIQDKMYDDKKLMDQFSNFYQSYLLIQSGVVDPSRLSYYIKDFPKKFIAEKWNEKYPDNPLIQAMRMNVDSKSKNPYLIINITGVDEQQKEELKYGWIDLHKVEPQLSQDLFNYNFFRAGIGFSPKTFMALVPTYVKERLKGADNQSSYVDTYRNFPEVVPKLVIDQFIRNNWSNTKLAPWKGGKNTHYLIDEKQGTLLVSKAEEIKDVKDFSYIKTSKNKVDYLWHQKGQTTDGILFRRVKPLGNNGEYLEMDTSEITNPMSTTVEASMGTTPSPMKEVSLEELNVEETPTPVISDTQEAKNLSELADLIMKQVPKLNREQALSKIEEMKGSERLYRKFLQNVFKQKGLTLDENESMNEFKKYC